jgi:bis(5'-adenosyl)-triphosphatase
VGSSTTDQMWPRLDLLLHSGSTSVSRSRSSPVSHPQNGQKCPFDHPGIRAAEYAGDDEFAAIYNIAPVLPGHSLVIPRRHVERLGLFSDIEVCHFFTLVRRITDFLSSNFKADGFDWAIQDGMSAGQTVGHVHLHVIPRWFGDLPSPGDWYRRLNLPIATNSAGAIDSDVRPRLSDAELNTVVTSLRAAATEMRIS